MLTPSPDSIDELYRVHYAPLYRLALALSGSARNAEDVVHDVFANAQRDWNRLRDHPNVAAWLRRSVINACSSRWRRLRSEAAYLSRRHAVRYAELPEHDREIWAAVRRLPLRQREVVVLVYVDDLTVTDAAVVMGCSVDTARTHHRRALERLGHLLGEDQSR